MAKVKRKYNTKYQKNEHPQPPHPLNLTNCFNYSNYSNYSNYRNLNLEHLGSLPAYVFDYDL